MHHFLLCYIIYASFSSYIYEGKCEEFEKNIVLGLSTPKYLCLYRYLPWRSLCYLPSSLRRIIPNENQMMHRQKGTSVCAQNSFLYSFSRLWEIDFCINLWTLYLQFIGYLNIVRYEFHLMELIIFLIKSCWLFS